MRAVVAAGQALAPGRMQAQAPCGGRATGTGGEAVGSPDPRPVFIVGMPR